MDAIRGLAALTVLIGHARALVLVDWDQARSHSAFLRLLYFVTGLHRHAVMVFFVLSGFFISGSILRGLAQKRWEPRRYAVARLVRLLVVLIPAVLLGLALDRAGLRWFAGSAAYAPGFGHMMPAGVTTSLGVDDVVRTLMFLQTIVGPVVGTNGPTWSLANEFWYYVAFPCFALAVVPGRVERRVLASLLGLATLAFIGPVRAEYFGIWLLGTAVALLPPTRLSRSAPFSALTWVAFVASLAFRTAVARSDALAFAGDCLIALTFAAALWSTASRPTSSVYPLYGSLTGLLSGLSYTLYLVHLPFLFFLVAFARGTGDRLQPGVASLGLMVGLILAAVLYAVAVWALAERHTDAVRAWVERALLVPRPGRERP